MRRISKWTLLLLLAGLSACAAPKTTVREAPETPAPETAALPIDPDVRTGKLPNGMTYLIRANRKPEHRAELRLAVNAGSVLEDDDQLGLAHFTEHMAFNGTTHFEKQKLVDYLESIGMRLGPDLNAYTSFDETVYMLQVPTDSAATFDTALRILRDWASEVAFEDEEIDKERGVVIEEWRLGRGASARLRDQELPILLHGSRYAERLPIGTKEVLESFPHDAVKRFYRDWYRPDLMAVVIVGDVDAAAVERQIRSLFADLPAREDPRPRPFFDVPDHDETLFAIASDPEATTRRVAVYYKQPKAPQGTEADFRRGLVERLYNSLFNSRLSELLQSADPPFVFASSGRGAFTRTKDVYVLQAVVRDGGYARALETLLTEAERVRRFGFTPAELERGKKEVLRGLEQAFAERDKTESRRYAAEYVRHYLTGEPIPGIAYEYEAAKRLLPDVGLDEVNRVGASWITDRNRVILAEGPEEEGRPLPTEAELLAVFDAVAARTITPYEETVSDAPLVPAPPAPGKVVEETRLDAIGVVRWTLSNGVHVVLKPTDFKNDEILIAATSPGGTSLVPDSMFTPASFAATLIAQSGVGDFGPVELQKKLAGKLIRLSPNIGDRSEGFNGSASPQDLETMFQLLYLYFTAPRADSVAYASYKERIGSLLATFRNSPESAFRDTLTVTLAQYHPRARPFSERTLEEMDLAKSMAVYRDRFADASDFTFYLVGAFDVEAVRPLVETYLGGLPALHRKEEPRDVGIRPPKGVVEKAVYKGKEPKSRVQIVLTGEAPWSNENRRLLRVVTDVLSLRLREVLREDLGGVYGVGVNGSLSKEPREAYRVSISFGCAPERVDELTRTVFEEMARFRTEGTTETYLVKAREAALRRHEVGLEQNSYWLGSLMFSDEYDLDPNDIPDGAPRFYEHLTLDAVHEAARTFLDPANYVRVVLYLEDCARGGEGRTALMRGATGRSPLPDGATWERRPRRSVPGGVPFVMHRSLDGLGMTRVLWGASLRDGHPLRKNARSHALRGNAPHGRSASHAPTLGSGRRAVWVGCVGERWRAATSVPKCSFPCSAWERLARTLCVPCSDARCPAACPEAFFHPPVHESVKR
ncbi:M16 family metallopeptidase [Rhodocaloribacter sp.]